MVPVLAVTGGVGAGKSVFVRHLETLGARVLDADAEAHAVLDEPRVRDELVRRFGGDILTDDGRADRQALAERVFRDAESLRRHTEVVYPALRRRLGRRLADLRETDARPVVLEAATLFEAGARDLVDHVVTVEAPLPLREERCRTARGWTPGEATRRDAFLLGEEERRRRADEVVENTGDENDLRRAAEAVYRRLCAST
ncbi:MAG: dephospho-CoA kinase [Planctomycetota bacterium]